ncbi:hypothetical protein [Komagataeibacter kakiaceti]|nr:hypothetical protein [Komagataeibacter kakiaceti]
MFDALIEGGRDRVEAARTLLAMEPFNNHPDIVTAFLDKVARETAGRKK